MSKVNDGGLALRLDYDLCPRTNRSDLHPEIYEHGAVVIGTNVYYGCYDAMYLPRGFIRMTCMDAIFMRRKISKNNDAMISEGEK